MQDQNEVAEIITTYSSIFINADTHNWEGCQNCFVDEPEIDYSSLNGQPAAEVKAVDLISNWKGFLPRFEFTMHYLTNHRVVVEGNRASGFCYGHAIHHLPNAAGGDLWGVYGTYEFELVKTEMGWRVIKMRYNHKYQDGNPNLPALASQGDGG
jgi:hypothetical protein